ncbi:hypothetical protein OC835_007933 [Tilletia horrida]|nr:hypothetical protein OC835_007933 [Tilletia horrida]
MSKTSLHRYLKEWGVQKRVARSKQLLKAHQRTARLRCARQNAKSDWRDVIFTDEATLKLDGTVRRW